MNVGGSHLMRIHRRRIPFSEDISSLYSPLNQQLPAVLRGRSMLIDIAHPSAFHPPYISNHMNASTIAYIRVYVPPIACVCMYISLSPSLSPGLSLFLSRISVSLSLSLILCSVYFYIPVRAYRAVAYDVP